MENHTFSEPIPFPEGSKQPCWKVDVYRRGVDEPVWCLEVHPGTLPPRRGNKKNKVVWKLPDTLEENPRFGGLEKERLWELFKQEKKNRRKSKKKGDGGCDDEDDDGSWNEPLPNGRGADPPEQSKELNGGGGGVIKQLLPESDTKQPPESDTKQLPPESDTPVKAPPPPPGFGGGGGPTSDSKSTPTTSDKPKPTPPDHPKSPASVVPSNKPIPPPPPGLGPLTPRSESGPVPKPPPPPQPLLPPEPPAAVPLTSPPAAPVCFVFGALRGAEIHALPPASLSSAIGANLAQILINSLTTPGQLTVWLAHYHPQAQKLLLFGTAQALAPTAADRKQQWESLIASSTQPVDDESKTTSPPPSPAWDCQGWAVQTIPRPFSSLTTTPIGGGSSSGSSMDAMEDIPPSLVVVLTGRTLQRREILTYHLTLTLQGVNPALLPPGSPAHYQIHNEILSLARSPR